MLASTSEGAAVHHSAGIGARTSILLLFFLSGACALTYEVVWMRMLTLVFGATAFATSTILASFFAGLALGGVYFGRQIDRGRNPLLVYALLEAGIGLCAFLMPLVFAILTVVYVAAARHLPVGYYGINLIRFVLSFLVLLVPATLMGGTLPVIVKFFASRRERLGWDVGRLYATNTFGAVVGTLSAGFFLILMFGVRETAYLAGVVNLLIAGISLVLYRQVSYRADHGIGTTDAGEQPVVDSEAFSPKAARLALWTIGISGFCALALEVFWTRSLVFFLDNSTHAFTTILTAFLLGIALGSVIVARFIDTGKRLLAWLGVIQILIGFLAVLAIPILVNSTPVFGRMASVSVDTMLPWKWMGMRFVNSLMVMLLPTILMGMAFPLASKIYTRSVGRVGAALGNFYAVNTIGGMVGSVLAGFVLIPVIGVHNGIVLIAAINVVVGIVLVLSEPLGSRKLRLTTAVACGVLLAGLGSVLLVEGPPTLTSYYEGLERPEVLSYDEGIGATVKVYRDSAGDKTLSVNGFPVAGTALTMQEVQKGLAHLPLLLSNVSAPRVNIIGFGTGGTSWGVTLYDVEMVDCVELVPAVPRAAHWFPEINHDVLNEPRFNLIREDGRNYALVSDEVYDVISVDATSPKMAGNGSLYALEFYELMSDRLSDEGMLVQWLPFHLVSDREVKMIAKTLLTVFPHTTVWFTPLRQYAVLVATKQKLRIDFAAMSDKLARANIQRELEMLNTVTPIDLLSTYVMGGERLAEYVGDADLNTDNRPYLEFTPAMAYFVSDFFKYSNIRNLLDARETVFRSLVNTGETSAEIANLEEALQRRFEARTHSINGDILLRGGMQEEAQAEYEAALAIDPDEKNWLNSVWLLVR